MKHYGEMSGAMWLPSCAASNTAGRIRRQIVIKALGSAWQKDFRAKGLSLGARGRYVNATAFSFNYSAGQKKCNFKLGILCCPVEGGGSILNIIEHIQGNVIAILQHSITHSQALAKLTYLIQGAHKNFMFQCCVSFDQQFNRDSSIVMNYTGGSN